MANRLVLVAKLDLAPVDRPASMGALVKPRHAPLILVALTLAIFWLQRLWTIGPESEFFTPFRYEGLLFFRNAMALKDWRFFFVHDWSTSPDLNQHPLLYFRNLDFVHTFAGAVQYIIPGQFGALALYLMSMALTLASIILFWRALNESLPVKSLILLALLVPQSAIYAGQNLFLACLMAVGLAWWSLLYKYWQQGTMERKTVLKYLALSAGATLVETNLSLFLALTAGCIFLFEGFRTRGHLRHALFLVFLTVLSVTAVRLAHLGVIDSSGHFDLFLEDLKFTRLAKIAGNISNADALAFYRQRGLNFFGLSPSQTPLEVIQDSAHYLAGKYKLPIFSPILLLAVALLRFGRIKNPLLSFSILVFLVSGASTLLMVPLTGNTFLNLGLSPSGFLDFLLPQRICFLLVTFLTAMETVQLISKSSRAHILIALLAVLALFADRYRDLAWHRPASFAFQDMLKKVEPNSNVISNFEPSILAIASNSRALMSWYDDASSSCLGLSSPNLIPFFRGPVEPWRRTYIFEVFYPPYTTGSAEASKKRACLEGRSHRILAQSHEAILVEVMPP